GFAKMPKVIFPAQAGPRRCGHEKGGPGNRTASFSVWATRLALRELEGTAGLGAAVLLALDHARIAGEEALALDRGAQARLVAGERGRDAVADRAGLAGKAAAG